MFAIGLFENGSAVARNHGRQNENVTSEAHNSAARELVLRCLVGNLRLDGEGFILRPACLPHSMW